MKFLKWLLAGVVLASPVMAYETVLSRNCLDNQILVAKCNGKGTTCLDIDFCKEKGDSKLCRSKWKALENAGATGLIGDCPKTKKRCTVKRCDTSGPSVPSVPSSKPTMKPTVLKVPTMSPTVKPTEIPKWPWVFSFLIVPFVYVLYTHPDETSSWMKKIYDKLCCRNRV